MKLSISNIAWDNKDDVFIYKTLKENGFSAIEIAPTRFVTENPYDSIQEIGKQCDKIREKFGLTIASMQSILYGRKENIFNTEEERNTLIQYMKKAIDLAHTIKCPNLVFGCPKNRLISSVEQKKYAIYFFDELGKYAIEKNTIVAIEPNPVIYGTNFINTTEEAFEFVQELSNPGIKVNLDLGTIIENDESLENIFQKISFINHIHISEPYLECIKQRSLHKELRTLLEQYKYDGYVSIEMKKQDNVLDVINTIAYVKEIFHGI